MSHQPQHAPAGAPAGGQFITTSRPEPGLTLVPTPPADRRYTVAEVDELIAAAGLEVTAVQQVAREAGDRMYALRNQQRRAQQALDTAWTWPATGEAPADLVVAVTDSRSAASAAAADQQAAHTRVETARAAQLAAQGHYPWTGTDTPAVEVSGGRQRPGELSPSGRYAYAHTNEEQL
ncbi:hypothetical protein [Pengzhenrongella sp.]|jgi:hypothetical protein|uniref:hypothetical protein n=1 Tax=Pengzhenrongella sp. TaxID=2888820 RepID=UPI002F94203E